MDRSQWFNQMWDRAPHSRHISASSLHSCRVLIVIENVAGDDADNLSINSKGVLRCVVVDDGHRRDWKVRFNSEATRSAIIFPSVKPPQPQNKNQCLIQVFSYKEVKAIDQVFECTMGIKVNATAEPQEVFLTTPVFETVTPMNPGSRRKLHGIGERMLNTVIISPAPAARQEQSLPPQPPEPLPPDPPKKPILKLNGTQRKQLQECILRTFPSRFDLEQMVSFELDVDLNEIAGNGTLKEVAFEFIKWAQAKNRINDLVNAVKQYTQNLPNFEDEP